MALFVLASKDGWVSIMYTGLDAVGVDQQVINIFIFIPQYVYGAVCNNEYFEIVLVTQSLGNACQKCLVSSLNI